MKTFIYFFEKANININDELLNKFKLNFKKAELTTAASIKGIHSCPGTFFKFSKSETELKYFKEKQTWNLAQEIDGIKLFIGWYNDEFEEICNSIHKLKRETHDKLSAIDIELLDNKIYTVPALYFLPRSLQYNNKGELERLFSKRYKFLVDLTEKYFNFYVNGSMKLDEIEIYEDISTIMNVFYNINKYDILYSGIFDDVVVGLFFEKVLTIDYLFEILKNNEEFQKDIEKKSHE